MIEKMILGYENSIRYDSGYVMVYNQLGMIYHQLGKREKAIYNLERFIQLWQGEPDRIEDIEKLLEQLKEEQKE
jgi:regulator of sirC expression with transglutaminase-like and TPR domain